MYLPKIPYIHRIYMVLANPTHEAIWSQLLLLSCWALQWCMSRVGQNRVYTPYMTVYFVIPCQKYRVYIRFWQPCAWAPNVWPFQKIVSSPKNKKHKLQASVDKKISAPLYSVTACNMNGHTRTTTGSIRSSTATPTVRTIYHAAKILFLGGAASSHPLKYINSCGGADWCGLNLNNYF